MPRRNTVRRRAASLLAWSTFTAAACGCAAAYAAKEIVPDIQFGVGTETNPRLESSAQLGSKANTSATVLDASVAIASFNQRSNVTFTPQLIANRYSGAADNDIESNDVYLRGNGERRWQTGGVGFDLDLSRVNVLRAELVEVDPDHNPDTNGPPDVDSGRLTLIGEDRTRRFLSPYVNFHSTPKGSFRIEAQTYSVSYSGANLSDRTGFDDNVVSFGLTRNVNPRSAVTATVALENYSAEVNNNDTDSVRLEGGLTRQINPLWSLTLAGGFMRNNFSFVPGTAQPTVSGSDSNVTARVALRKRSERSAINFSVIHDIGPSSNGFASLRNEVRVYFDRELTARLKTTIGVLASRQGAVGDVTGSGDRDYRRAEVSFDWEIRPKLAAVFGYNFTSQEFDEDATGLHDTQAIFVGIRYHGLSKR